jgi:class 3 adenylate cyclase
MSGGHLLAAVDGSARAIRCASALADAAARFGVTISVGLHTGECVIEDDSASGTPVELAARIADLAAAGEILVSRTVCDIVGDARLPFQERGAHEFPGLGSWTLFKV